MHGHRRQVLSRTTASPCPPEMQSVASPSARLALAHLVREGEQDPRATHPDRMAERDPSAEEVQPVPIELQLAFAGDHLRGEGLVDLDQVDVGEREAGLLEDLLRRGHRADAHDLGRNPGPAHPHDPRERLPALRLRARLRHQDHRGGAVGEAGGVAGGDRSTFAEHGRQGREPFERGVRTRMLVLAHGARSFPDSLDRHDLRGAGARRPSPPSAATPGRTRPAPRGRGRSGRRGSPPSRPSTDR